jgi:hypothetical protein
MTADDGAPAPLRAVARELLAEFRELDDMPADARARVRRLLAAGEAPRAREVSGGRDARASILWALVGAAAGVALLLGLKAVVPMVSERREAGRMEAAEDRVEREATSSAARVREQGRALSGEAAEVEVVVEVPEVLPEAVPEVLPEAVPEPLVEREGVGRRRAKTPTSTSTSGSGSGSGSGSVTASTLEAERRVIAKAWDEVARGEPGRAIESAKEHRERFPNGVLVPERTAVEAIARCKRDGDDGAARAFLKAHARSPLAGRVRTACAIDAGSAGSGDGRTPTGR